MSRDRLYAELLLRWSRTVEEHKLTFDAWVTATANLTALRS
jgi:hypothetical protein